MNPEPAEQETINRLIKRQVGLSANDAAFVQRVFDKGLGIYQSRLRQCGFADLGDVLDAGCGFGQWSIALARQNRSVTAVDIDLRRLTFLERLAEALEIRNVRAAKSDVWSMPFAAESFDAVFCYGVLFVTPWRETLRELARILRPGGRLYVNATRSGWYKHLLETNHNATSDYDPRQVAMTVDANTESYERGLAPKGDLLIDPAALRRALTDLGFHEIMEGPEGTLVVPNARAEVKPFASAHAVYEVLATR